MSDTPITHEGKVANNLGEWGRYYAGKPVSLTLFRAAETIRDLERQLADALAEIATMETRHAAVMLHTQSIVDEANATREQLDVVTKQRDELAARIGWEAALATLKGDKP